MLTIEEYIARRKKEDQINEFADDLRIDNLRICVNYVFEYFNQYMDVSRSDEGTVLSNQRLEKYKKSLSKYSPDLQDWLVRIYDTYDKQLNKVIVNYLKEDDLFLLSHSEKDFRKISYDCYASVVKKHHFIKEETEFLYLFIKDHHHIQSEYRGYQTDLIISEEVNSWFEETWSKYKVNLHTFSLNWVTRFSSNEKSWPVKHKIKTNESWRQFKYDYKQKNNLFNLNSLYTRISGMPFIKGKKQYLENLMMYFWLHEIEGDEDHYWNEYVLHSVK
jgi:hypothetical protein